MYFFYVYEVLAANGMVFKTMFQNHTMKKIITGAVCICLMGASLSSCVSKRRYVTERDKALKEQNDNLALNARLMRAADSMNMLHNKLTAMTNENAGTENELSKSNSELNMTREQVAAQRARLMQLQSFIDQQRQATEALRSKIADALTGFNSNELTVTMKNGRVYISMQEALLFPSGSAVVNPKGKDALSKVAGVLNTSTDINIDVEGHTDSIPIHNKMYNDNWSLSTARATSIAHVLIDDYKVNPAKLIASGRSEYDAVATNSTPDGRAQNRRTEIILEPKLDELMQLIGSPYQASK